MEKFARSTDPKQQALRDLKKSWQKEMKVFIAQSIALKRGIAGRGDAQAGLPPSNIKDPLPPEISTYIEEMSTRFSRLVDIAKQVVEHQAEYSQTRRKSPKEVPGAPVAAATAPEALSKLGSTPLSRVWTIWTQTPWFRDDQATKARLRLLSSLAELNHQLNDVEYILAGQDKRSVTHAFFAYLRFMGLFRTRVIDKFNNEIDRQRTEFTGKSKSEFDDLKKTVEIIHPSEAFRKAKESLEQKKQKVEESDHADPNSLKITRARDIVADIQSSFRSAIALHNSLIEIKAMEGNVINAEEMQLLARELVKIGNDIVAGKDVDFEAFDKAYKDLLKKVGEGSSFEDIVDTLNKKKQGFGKVAYRNFDRWVRRLKLSLYWDEFSKSKLDTVKKIRDLSLYIDTVMNLLEQKDAKLAELFTMFAEIYERIAVIAHDLVQFATAHNTYYGQQRASGEKHDIGPINQGDISGMVAEYKRLIGDVEKIMGQSVSEGQDG